MRRPCSTRVLLVLLAGVWSAAWATAPRVSELLVKPYEDNALRVIVDVSTSSEAAAYVEYWPRKEPTAPRSRTGIAGPATSHRITIVGCTPDTEYDGRVVLFSPAGQSKSEVFRFTTGPLPDGLGDLRVVIASDSLGGYILTDQVYFPLGTDPGQAPEEPQTLANLRALGYVGGATDDDESSQHEAVSQWLKIFDRAGRVVWYESFDSLFGFSLTSDASIVGAVRNADASSKRVFDMALDGTRLIDLEIADVPNHDAFKDTQGNMVVLTADKRVVDRTSVGGRPDEVVVGDGIVVYSPSGEEIWRWSSFDVFDPLTRRGDANGFWDRLYGEGSEDWLHSNAVGLDHDGNYLLSMRTHHQIAKIDSRTGDLIWILGREGDFPLPDDALFLGQHSITVTSGGRRLLFDNGDASRPWSRALAFELDETEMKAEIAWEFRLPPELYSFALSSAYELEDGHHLICSGVPGTVLETDADDNIIWQATSTDGTAIYRAFYLPGLYETPAEIEFAVRTSVASSSAPVSLIATPEGGFFDGPGVVGSTFDPAEAGPGVHGISYTYGWKTEVHEISVAGAGLTPPFLRPWMLLILVLPAVYLLVRRLSK